MKTRSVEVVFRGADGENRKVYFRYNNNLESIRRTYPAISLKIGVLDANFRFIPEVDVL